MNIEIDWMDNIDELGGAFDAAVDAYNAAVEAGTDALWIYNPAGDVVRADTRLKIAAAGRAVSILNYRYQIAMAVIHPGCSGNYLCETLHSMIRNLERCISEDHKAGIEYNTLGDAK